MFHWLRNRRRRKLLAEPFPPWWEAILVRNVGHYPRLSIEQQARLRDTTRILFAEKYWEGCGGLHITDEIKLTIAGTASLLLLGLDDIYFERVPTIVLYPTAFRSPIQEDNWEDDELSDTEKDGMAVYRGAVLLSWQEVLAECREPESGYNVVLHEFAHQLDFLDNEINGTPPLANPAMEATWHTVMQAAYDRHRMMLDQGADTFFTPHAGDDETEFFADATEAFYCRPADLQDEEPGVYSLLEAYYRVDPRAWFR